MSAADGAPCRSPMQNDPLVGIEVELIDRL
jgi:hypothetical protein